jgi:anti-sigma B factor antagonist
MELILNEHTIRISTIALDGRLDASSVNLLRETQEQLLKEGHKNFIADLSSVTFLDSAGLSALISLLKRARYLGGNMVLVQPADPAAMRILILMRFDQVFQIASNMQDALKFFSL